MAENDSKRVKGSVLVVAGAVLILVTVIILLSLRSPLDERFEREATASPPPGATAPTRTATPPAPPSSRPIPAPSVKPAPPPEVKVSAHLQAPPAIPSELAKETDPVKRAQLEKLHKLATARVRLSLLRRRERMLTESIARAKKDGSWSAGKLQEAERDLGELGAAIQAAARRLDEVRAEVGGDIDK